MKLVHLRVACLAASALLVNAASAQDTSSFFDFVTTQYFNAGKSPSIDEMLGPSNPNIEDSSDGISNAAVFSGRCWDKKIYRDFSTNGALVVYRNKGAARFFILNKPLTSNNELASESYFDTKQFRPWTDVSESNPYSSLTSAVMHDGSLMTVSYETMQSFLLRKMGDNYYTETVAVNPGPNPQLGEVQITCNFFKRLEKIADPAVIARLAEEARQRELARLASEAHYYFGPPNLGGYWYYHYHYNGSFGWPVPPWFNPVNASDRSAR